MAASGRSSARTTALSAAASRGIFGCRSAGRINVHSPQLDEGLPRGRPGRRTRLARRRSGRSEKGLAFALALALTIAPAFASGPQDAIRGFYATLLTTMKAGARLGESGRYAALAPVVQQVFDVPLMTRLAVGADLGGLEAGPAAAGDDRVQPLYRGDLCRPVRPIFGRSPRGGRRAGLCRRLYRPDHDRQTDRRSGDNRLLAAREKAALGR